MSLRFRSDARPEQLAKDLLLSPLIYIRLLGILCSIIVFGCVADKVLDNGECAYHGSTACNFAIAVGVIGFLFCLAFLVKDIMLVVIDYSDQLVVKKVIIIVDTIANGLWGFMWFVCFAYTADQLRRTTISSTSVRNCARAGVAFSFFCILIWIAIVVVNIILLIRVIKGSGRDGQGGTSGSGSGYASFPEAAADQPYQGEGGETGGGGGGQQYSPPEY